VREWFSACDICDNCYYNLSVLIVSTCVCVIVGLKGSSSFSFSFTACWKYIHVADRVLDNDPWQNWWCFHSRICFYLLWAWCFLCCILCGLLKERKLLEDLLARKMYSCAIIPLRYSGITVTKVNWVYENKLKINYLFCSKTLSQNLSQGSVVFDNIWAHVHAGTRIIIDPRILSVDFECELNITGLN